MKKFIIMMLAVFFVFLFSSCGDEPPRPPTGNGEQPDEVNDEDNGDTGNTGNSGDTGDTGNTGDTGDTGNTGNTAPDCDTDNMNKSCTLDEECGKCMICVGGKCIKGCISDDDCQMNPGLKCNKQLGRCLNVFASQQACGESKCPSGCCYAEKGLQGVKCSPNPSTAVCGLCTQGQVYDGSNCIPAVCSTTTDNCHTLNSHEKYPVCWECKSGEFICVEKTGPGGSKCSGVLISATACVPAGQQCVAGVSECCSGMPCVQGYCY